MTNSIPNTRDGTGHHCGQGDHFLPAACSGCFCQCYISQHYTAEHFHHCYQWQTGEEWVGCVQEPKTLDTLSQCGNNYSAHHTTAFSISTEKGHLHPWTLMDSLIKRMEEPNTPALISRRGTHLLGSIPLSIHLRRSGYQFNLRRKVWQTHMYQCVAMSNTVCNV